MKKIFWIVGDVSGDLHAANILQKLKDRNLYHYGIGGPLMQKVGFEPLFDFEKVSVMGFWDVIKKLVFFLNLEKKIKSIIRNEKPNLIILVDYPGLNLRIAEFSKKIGIKVLYYIAPQFWAWKYKRVYKLKKFTDLVAVIFPFEDEILKKEGVNSVFTGHPIAEEINFKFTKEKFAEKFSLDINKKWISFFPGSRRSEVKKIVPLFERIIEQLDKNRYEFIISQSRSLKDGFFEKINAKVIKGYNYDIMKHSDTMAITSGTATLEAAFIGTPFIIVYKTNKFNYFIGKKLIRTRWIGLPNILLQKEVFKEFIQDEANPNLIAKELILLMNKNQKEYTKKIKEMLGQKSASTTMSKIILEFI